MAQVFWSEKASRSCLDKSVAIVESLSDRAARTAFSRSVRVHDVGEHHAVAAGEGVDGRVACSLGYGLSLRMALGRAEASDGFRTDRAVVGSLGGCMHHARSLSPSDGRFTNGIADTVAPEMLGMLAQFLHAERLHIVIIDLDGSCGGGTASLIAGNSSVYQLDISVNDVDAYADTPNATLRVVADASSYLDVLRTSLDGLRDFTDRHRGSVRCIYSAGIDGFERAGRGLAGMTKELLQARDRMVCEWCLDAAVPTAYTLGCGDATEAMPMETVVALHRQTIETAVAVMWERSKRR